MLIQNDVSSCPQFPGHHSWAAVTKCCKLSGLKNRGLFSPSSGGEKLNRGVEVLTRLVLLWPLSLPVDGIFLRRETFFYVCVQFVISSSYKNINRGLERWFSG